MNQYFAPMSVRWSFQPVLWLIFICVFSLSANVNAQNQLVDSLSSVQFEVGNAWVNTVKGTFDAPSGTVLFDVDKPAQTRIEVQVASASVATGIEARDNHLRKEDFFDAAQYAYVKVVSEQVSPGSEPMLFNFSGFIFIKGKKVPLACTFTAIPSGDFIKLQSEFEVERKALGLGVDHGNFVINETVLIKVELVVRK